ncbi:RagB/SusD family nutrient uptake outer membrane protein [Segetibacter sp. 3557_3]|uniref:RagB/SusD family nutrient uptake outer membrane protein n=1 Tax=Segetibacter sp. 3557_3 TaxID=2547429 RepID=UPI001058B4E4|nr:RagB/SusD family nutrient uptake outer membrane protein [Segetibacter sp. 3557_3]TDH26593.1 RagB/SusD family nutrient uptake outer membrane protein [Segetibacter sp. 3557_3]
MKKNILSITALSVLVVVFGGCTKLDETIYDRIPADQFVPTEKDIPSLIAPVYTNLRPMHASWHGNFDLQEESADIIVTPVRPNGWFDGGTYQRMHEHKWNPVQSQPNNLWAASYRGINLANRLIFQIESGAIPVSTGKENLVAEMKAARAYYYYMLLDNHGNVPIVTDYQDVSLPKQSTRQQVYDFVVKEFTDNIPLLSDKADKLTYGRFNRWAAKGILAKVYLNAGVYTGTPQWDKCIAECNDIIAAAPGRYILEPDYKSPFRTENQNSKELILAVPYDEILATEFNMHMKSLDPVQQAVFSMSAQPWGGSAAVPQFINTYDPDDSRLKDTWIWGPQINATTGAVAINYTKHLNGIALSGSDQGYRMAKYEIKQGARAALSVDYPLVRYADVLMMKAESLLRTGKADEAADIVSQVRERAFRNNSAKAKVTGAQLQMGSSYQYGYYNTNGSISELQGGADIPFGRFLDELGWEFAAEGRRRQDIIRFGVFSTKIWFNHRPAAATRQLFPIHENEIIKNPNLKQNPGY